MGCYSFANHVLAHHPEVELGFEHPDRARGAAAPQLPDAEITHARGLRCRRTSIARASRMRCEAASAADVAIVVVGDRAGLFGRGTVGEGNDVESLELPGVQRQLVEAVVATGTPRGASSC